jgi:hypothetical protein
MKWALRKDYGPFLQEVPQEVFWEQNAMFQAIYRGKLDKEFGWLPFSIEDFLPLSF